MTSESLSPAQAHALLDILTHHEAYQEIRDLRKPGTLAHSGPPFKTVSNENRMPLLHALFSQFMVPLPGLRDVSPDFYQAKCQQIIEEFAQADLSESYEAGYIGIRRTLATAGAALIEAPARGYYGGFAKKPPNRSDGNYDASKAEDVVAAFQDFLQGIAYGNLIEELIDQIAKSDKLEDQPPMVQAAHEYILIILASFLHYILIITPEGQTMLTMLKQANALIPYGAIRQALRIGNAATMINAMMKIILTKMTINSVTTFLRLTNPSDAGWNLLQTIIWTVVNWDTNSLKQRALDIERSSDAPSKTQLQLLKTYVDEKNSEEHRKCRMQSLGKSEPIVKTIMDEYDGGELSETQIPLALDYLSIQVSLRDRKKIVDILCSRQPDLLTQAVREGVAAYDPVIRGLHNAVDLSGTIGDVQTFMDDLLAFAPSGKNASIATAGDFVRLLRKHQASVHKFLHQLCKNGPELIGWYKEFISNCAVRFRIDDDGENIETGGAGKLNTQLNELVSNLSEQQKSQVLAECDAYAIYLSDLAKASEADMKFEPLKNPELASKRFMGIRSSRSSTPKTSREPSPVRTEPGPGMFLRRWQAYVNETVITPARPNGPMRYGSDHEVISAGRVANISISAKKQKLADLVEVKHAPSCTKTVQFLGKGFKELLKEVGKTLVEKHDGLAIN